MSHTAVRLPAAQIVRVRPILRRSATYQAFKLLHVGYTLGPILAGIDKFANQLTDWSIYLAPRVESLLPVQGQQLLGWMGGIEILIGVLVAARPRIGGYVLAVWLWAIIANLLMIPGYYDVALRDFGLSLGAVALARLSRYFD